MRHVSLPLLVLLAVIATPASASAQGAVRAAGPDGGEPAADRFRARLGMEMVTRRFDLVGPTDVEFVAPYYRGLRIEAEAFPVAWFARDSAAAPLFLALEVSKHATTTVVGVDVEGTEYDLDIPTRHDMSFFGLGFEWQATSAVTVVPRVGWRTTEFSLAYNDVLRSSFYRGVELSVRGDFGLGRTPVTLSLGADVRPAVSLGSTADAFGDDASCFGIGGLLRASWRARFGLVVAGDARIERFGTRFTRSGGAGSDATDVFQSFVVSVGYAI